VDLRALPVELSLPLPLQRLAIVHPPAAPGVVLDGRQVAASLDVGFPRGGPLRGRHGPGLPLADPPSGERRTVRLADVHPIREQVDDGDIAAVVIDVHFLPAQPVEQARADVAAALERDPMAGLHPVPARRAVAEVSCPEQQERQVIT
jgi:hypothetical protein